MFAWRILQEIALSGGRLPVFFAPSSLGPYLLTSDVKTDTRGLARVLFGERTAIAAANPNSFEGDLVADFALWESLPRLPLQPLPVPIAAFIGDRDPTITPEDMKTWSAHTTGSFSLTVLPGDHSYLYQAGSGRLLARELAQSFLDAAFSVEGGDTAVRRLR
jgi:surfactin synthase thioesterase subunit